MRKRVVVVGGVNADITGFSKEPVVMNDSNPGRIEISAGGVGRNIGENLLRMGFEVGMLTVFSDDALGSFLVDDCEKTGIDISCCPVLKGDSRTSIYMSTVDSDGEMVTAVSDMRILDSLTIDHLEACSEKLDQAEYIVLDANLSVEMIEAVTNRFAGHKFVIDPVSTSKARKLKGLRADVELMKPNILEAEVLSGIRLDTESRIVDGLGALNSMGIRWVLLTDGKNGAWLSGEGRTLYCPSFEIEGANVNGAGDAFLAGAVYGLSISGEASDMLYYGHAAASMAMESDRTVSRLIGVKALEDRTRELKRCLRIKSF